jgi:hypothetical protein
MAKPSEVIVLVEDVRQQQIVRRYLRQMGLEAHAMRFELPSAGSGEQWVREQLPVEVLEYRRRRTRAETKLIIVTDADNLTLAERMSQLDRKLKDSNIDLIRVGVEQIARLIPRRNIESWILCLNGVAVNESDDYKRTRNDWSELIRPAAERLYVWSRPNAVVPNICLPSLQDGLAELGRLDFNAN